MTPFESTLPPKPSTLPNGTFALPSNGRLSVNLLELGFRDDVVDNGGLWSVGEFACVDENGGVSAYAGGVGGRDGTRSSMEEGNDGALLCARTRVDGAGAAVEVPPLESA